MRKFIGFLSAVLLGTCLASVASADLILTIRPASGGTLSYWEFSGTASTLVNPGGLLNAVLPGTGNLGTNADAWGDVGDYTAVNDLEGSVIGGAATVTVSRLDRFGSPEVHNFNIDLTYIDDDGAGAFDDFGIGIDNGGSDFTLNEDDEVSWSGLVLSSVAHNDLTLGTYNITNYGINGELPLTLVVTAIPEPAGVLGFFALGLVGLTIRRRKS